MTEVPRDELQAAIEARKEVGEDMEPALIDAFVERIERRFEHRGVQSEEALKAKREHQKEMVMGAMAISVPLFAIEEDQGICSRPLRMIVGRKVSAASSYDGSHALVWPALGIVILVLALLTSCGSSAEPRSDGSPPTASTTSDDDAPAPQDRCPGGKTRPLTIRAVIEAARQHDITLYDDPACTPEPTIEREASNILLYGPHTNVAQQSEIEQREGFVICALSATPQFGSTVERIRYPGDEETNLRLLNVNCVIYPDPPSADEQLARLEQTMNDLERDAQKADG